MAFAELHRNFGGSQKNGWVVALEDCRATVSSVHPSIVVHIYIITIRYGFTGLKRTNTWPSGGNFRQYETGWVLQSVAPARLYLFIRNKTRKFLSNAPDGLRAYRRRRTWLSPIMNDTTVSSRVRHGHALSPYLAKMFEDGSLLIPSITCSFHAVKAEGKGYFWYDRNYAQFIFRKGFMFMSSSEGRIRSARLLLCVYQRINTNIQWE